METIQEEVQIPEQVEALIDTIAERWGYYFGKRTTQSELMKATSAERTKVRTVGNLIKAKITDYLINGADVREEVVSMQGQLKEARATLSEKSKPFYDKVSPLNKALSYLDKVVIPQQLEQVKGEKILPRFQVADYTLKAITASK